MVTKWMWKMGVMVGNEGKGREGVVSYGREVRGICTVSVLAVFVLC